MRQMKRITLRLSLENPTDKKIADFLANIDKNKYHTVNNAIKTILYSVINGNATEKSEKSDMKEIISVIRTTLETEIPKLISVFGSSNHTKIEQDKKPVEKSADTLDDDDIDMNFIGG